MEENWKEGRGDLYSRGCNISGTNCNISGTNCINYTSTVTKFAHVARPTIAALGAFTSIIGIIVIIGVMVKVKKHRTFNYRLILYLLVSILCVSITQAFSVLPVNKDYKDICVREGGWEEACAFIGYLSVMSAWLEHVVIAWITVYIILLVHPQTQSNKVKIMKICEVVGALIWVLTPLLLGWIPFVTGSYGLSGLWCWIKITNEQYYCEMYIPGLMYELFLYFVPFFVVLLFNITTLFVVFFYFCKNYYKDRQACNKKALKIVISFCLYAIVYDIHFVTAFASRISQAFAIIHKENPNFNLLIAHSLSECGRCFYPPFMFLVISAAFYFHGKYRQSRRCRHVHTIAADPHASHGMSTRHTETFPDSETHVRFPTEFVSNSSVKKQDQFVTSDM